MNYAVSDLPHLVRCAVEAVRSSVPRSSRHASLRSTDSRRGQRQGISADTRWGEQDRPVLCIAAHKGSVRALTALLVGHANHALADKQGRTAAHDAALYGQTACLRQLIDAGAEKDALMTGNFTPLHLAAQGGHPECCSLLLERGSDANARTTEQGRNAFHLSICWGNLECFELMLPLITDVDVRAQAGVNADGSPIIVFNNSPLHIACSFGQERMVKALLNRGASRTARDSRQSTPLHHAALSGHLGCVRQLLGKPGA